MVTIVAAVLGIAALYPWMKGWWFVPAVLSLFLVPAALFALSKGVGDVFAILAAALAVAWAPVGIRAFMARSKSVSFGEAPQIWLTVRR